jgi:hypothetical protein
MERLACLAFHQEQAGAFYFHIRRLSGILLVRHPVAIYARGYFGFSFMTIDLWPNTALEPTATAPLFCVLLPIHACGCSRRGSALDR